MRAEVINDDLRSHVIAGHLRFAASRGVRLAAGATILDFGCGAGDTVRLLVSMGYDAYGLEISRGWSDAHPVATRLYEVNPRDYRLPFSDGYFDFCFSDQVIEHVADCVTVFREIARVLKPTGISLHRFPGPNGLVEGHINVPLPALCRSRAYVAFWTLMGRRPRRLSGVGWRQALEDNIRTMKICHYWTKRQLRSFARRAGVRIDFAERNEFQQGEIGGLAALRRAAERLGLGPPARLVLPAFAQRYMVLWPAKA